LINAGEFVTMDYGAVYEGYHSDITRTICVGHADSKQRDIYDAVLQAQLLGLSLVRPGASGKSVDGEVRKYLHERGYAEYFGHGLGHSLGLEIHEAPTLSPRSTCEALQPNTLITVEPGVYIPDWGGVRIEDTVLVTDTSNDVLTSSSKELMELTF
jgi:Xaa-Pro aminopeptidase